MFYLEKKSYQAIASETGFSLLQVKSYIQNGKRNLRLLLEKKIRSIWTSNMNEEIKRYDSYPENKLAGFTGRPFAGDTE